MAKKAKAKRKAKPTLADVVQVSSLQAARIRVLEAALVSQRDRIERLEVQVFPLPSAEPPAGDAGEAADAANEQEAADEGATG